jgi:Prolyl oligopeptidase family
VRKYLISLTILVSVLGGCGGGSNSPTATIASSTTHGTLVANPPLRLASLTAADFQATLSASPTGTQLLAAAGTPACGVDFYYLNYYTTGGNNEPTLASGALMVPTGGSGCSGARPIVLYAHGTTTAKNYNIANITDTTNPAASESALIAAVYAAQGFIVVAPNYAGYDISTLTYHPYLNANQQAGEMMDALAAARTALPNTFAKATTDSGQLLLTGYSQGGHVALATMRALQQAGKTVTAAAPGSGPYAMEAFGDSIFLGNVNVGSTVFAPLVTTSYQKAYGDLYAATTDIYNAPYAAGIETLLPSTQSLTALFASGALPQSAFFAYTTPTASDLTALGVPAGTAALAAGAMAVPANQVFALGFSDTHPLVSNAYRINYVLDALSDPDGAIVSASNPSPAAADVQLAATTPTNKARKALKLNDLRNNGSWYPTAPVLMCGGVRDPTVFYAVNTLTMKTFWSGLPAGLINTFSVDPYPATTSTNPLQAAFLTAYATIASQGGAAAVVASYHGTLVPPLCTLAARGFFQQILSGAG